MLRHKHGEGIKDAIKMRKGIDPERNKLGLLCRLFTSIYLGALRTSSYTNTQIVPKMQEK